MSRVFRAVRSRRRHKVEDFMPGDTNVVECPVRQVWPQTLTRRRPNTLTLDIGALSMTSEVLNQRQSTYEIN